jgi:hypothetical protein
LVHNLGINLNIIKLLADYLGDLVVQIKTFKIKCMSKKIEPGKNEHSNLLVLAIPANSGRGFITLQSIAQQIHTLVSSFQIEINKVSNN